MASKVHATKRRPVHLMTARPSFLEGLARLFDFGNALAAYPWMAERYDAAALAGDWRAIGQDMQQAMEIVMQRDKDASHADKTPIKK